MADLTRFDFHALRFIKSDSIAEMSLEEIGQYILLLSEAWLSGKDASLPNNLEILSRAARCKKVSDKVLAQFPIVETPWGPRRQNETLYNEWRATNERLALASDSGRRGNEVRWGSDRVPMGSRSTSDGVPVARPDQTRPTHTIPDQTSYNGGVFKFIAVRYSSWFGINHSHGKKHIEKYQLACSKFGEDTVLAAFDTWAASAGWLKEKRDSNGLNFFWKPLEEIIEGDQLRVAREESVRKVDTEQEEKIKKVLAEQDAIEEKQMEQEREERRKQKEFEAQTANEI